MFFRSQQKFPSHGNNGGSGGNREHRPSQHSSVASVASDIGRLSLRSKRDAMIMNQPIGPRVALRVRNKAIEVSLAYTRSRCEIILKAHVGMRGHLGATLNHVLRGMKMWTPISYHFAGKYAQLNRVHVSYLTTFISLRKRGPPPPVTRSIYLLIRKFLYDVVVTMSCALHISQPRTP